MLTTSNRSRWPLVLVLGTATALLFAATPVAGEDGKDAPKPGYAKPPQAENVPIVPEAWETVPTSPLSSGELDNLLTTEHKSEQLKTAARTTDEQFLRRVTLDITGKLPLPADVVEFVASKEPQKRAKAIDKLLASDDFNRHWARLWTDVVGAHATEQRVRLQEGQFEDWLTKQMKENKSWVEMARAMLTAKGALTSVERDDKNDATYFLLTHSGADAVNERAAETARVFMGIQIQCAQCHDHPNDLWKRQHFHELASFFARTRERPIREDGRLIGIALNSQPIGEHRMPDKDDPKKTTLMQPRFLTGEKYPPGKSDADRREALAKLVTGKENYWFAAAFVNRTWGELMGQGFYQPVDNMGPLQEATYPNVLLRLAAHFRSNGYDVRDLYRLVMNSETYQRQIRLGDAANQHLHFAGAYPTRLRSDALWESLVSALGSLQAPRPDRMPGGGMQNRILQRFGFEGVFKRLFDFDPSTKPDEVEGSVSQVLMMMNNRVLNDRMRAQGNTVLARILQSSPNDDEAIRMVYLRILARKPTARELQISRDYLRQSRSRVEGYEDLYWTLINSTEFLTKR